ncbi:MAG TPA: VIT and VWA domain-containing protein [Candidatus Limnocylindria bacterium]|nr:VIT and VWA domain-containing protein [Candidatus Limnocylindria bacterium]
MKLKVIQKAFAVALAAIGILAPPSMRAAGLLVADGGFGGVLEVKEHDVQVTINNGIAVTKVTQVFHNTESRQVEALYTFPVPKGASIANFSMWINGKEMVGEVLEKKRAREIYESYKQTRRDPGLLEQVDFKTFEMRIFPIAPNADQKVQLTYYQELDVDHDTATYVYPLATATRKNVDSRTTGRFAFNVEIKSAIPIGSVESPSHAKDFVVAKHTDGLHQASLETKEGSLARDIVISCQLARPKTGFDLVASKRDGEDGYFSLTLTAGEDLAKLDTGMDYVFLLDISGSMAQDGKLLLSKDSIGAFVNELSEQDRIEIITFNVQPNLAFKELRQASAQNKEAAQAFLASQQARGGTVLNPAVTTAYKYANADRPLNVIIFSDGMTEQQERRTLLQLISERPRSARVFCIGVGNDVNKPLLEQLAQDSGGLAAFLSPEDNFGRQAKAFRRKLTRPVASDLKIEIAGVEVSDIEPKTMPNLYHGSPVRIYGRYKNGGVGDVKIRGSINGMEFKKTAQLEFPKSEDGNPELERMWAWHRIDGLLKDADRTGTRNEVAPEIVRLGEGYSIVTEYTSFLVLENDAEFQRWKIARNNVLRSDRDRKAQEVVRAEFEKIRSKAVADLGPQSPEMKLASATRPQTFTPVTPAPNNVTPTPAATSPTPPKRSVDFNLGGGGGSGPVGPLFVALIAMMRMLRPARRDQ